ncbi:SWI SNF complex [Chlorella sorokiniana]|uniref:SWI SNF complex n=1 Tax=Chlorella sorokiniana TaxID=3076 RepID=A0A2P6TT78_CHLSO|nr:SWI SNF complex [Chlorella sorokiniana]|eukprot:PRW57272.1 SWI SNF complex [Chlorella sorokiniana]
MANRLVLAVGQRNGHAKPELSAEPYVSALEGMVQRLAERGHKYDKRSLAQLIGGLAQFMEDALGVNALYKPFTRLPARLLYDTSVDGPLAIIAAACSEHVKTRNLKRIEWLAPQMRKENMELFGRIRAELLRSGYVRTPVVYVHPANGPAVPKLQEAVRSLKGDLAQSESGATHVVHPMAEGVSLDDSQRYARLLEVQGSQAKVHWWYLPDSYDEWVPAAATPGAAEALRRPPRGPWHVYARWLSDSEKYNEWMNPVDYETADAAADEGKRRREGEEEEPARKPKAARQAGPLPEILAGAGEPVAEGVTRQKVLQPHRKAMEPASLVDISQGQRAEDVLMPSAAVQVAPELAEAVAARQAQWAQQGAAPAAAGQQDGEGAQGEPYLVPACAAWFRWDAIADVEEAHFRDFLSADPANPERYREYRNAIINKYREDESRVLSFTEARRALVGDVNLLRRVWKFLDSWQLINFMARRRAAPGGTESLGPRGSGGLPMSGAEALFGPTRRASVEAGATAALTGNMGASGGSVRVRSNVFGSWARQSALATKADFFCRGADCGALCTELRHHCLKRPDLDLCPKCFKEGKFPSGMSSKDFIRLEAADAVPDESGWTDQETLLLLEGIEKYGESWQQVAEHVGGRSAMQCVARFLQLPTEEALAADVTPGPTSHGLVAIPPPGQPGGLAVAAEVLQDVLPFGEAPNPVIAQVSFLATMVGPKLAAAAAQRALEVLAEEDAAAAAEVAQELAAAQAGGGDVPMPDAGKNGQQPDGPISAGRTRLAAATGLAAAAVQAKLLADQEEREVQRAVLAAIEQQFKKVHTKLQYLEEMDAVLSAERLSLETMRGQFIDQYQKEAHQNMAAGLGPPPGRPMPPALEQQQQPAAPQQGGGAPGGTA